jgi:hypothetical protein
LSLPLYLIPVAACLIPTTLLRLRHQLVPWEAWLLLALPYVTWLIVSAVHPKDGSLANSTLEPALIGVFTGLAQLPQILFPGADKRDSLRRFVAALCAAALFAVFVATSAPSLPE